MRYGSVCSGIEAATVAWHPLGCDAAWYTEVERFCCDLLKHYYPETPNLGDITTLEVTQIEELGPIDVLVGGTPCQSFSVAGLRKGMADPRGNLALRFLQLAGTTGTRWVLWENVPGVLSSNKGRDFAAFLGGMEELGYGWAYRILDAQYIGVPQRRRRVFVVGYLGDWRGAAAVLFERSCLCGHPPPSRQAGAGVAGGVAGCLESTSSDYSRSDVSNMAITHSLRAEGFDASEDGTGKGTPLVFDTTQVTSPGNYSEPKAGDPSHPLAKGQHPPAICFHARQDPIDSDQSLPLEAQGGQAVAYQCHGSNVGPMGHLRAGNQNVTGGVPFVFQERGRSEGRTLETQQDVAYSLLNPGNGGRGQERNLHDGMAVRRLTPRECERLQGFPDDYTRIPYRGKPADKCPDGPRYKALGNSMAVPVMQWIGERILEAERTQ